MTTTVRSALPQRDRIEDARRMTAGPTRAPTRRRWGRTGAGVGAASLGAWVFVAAYLSTGDRIEVLVVDRPLDRFEPIGRSDLRVERVPPDLDIATVPAVDLDAVLGRPSRVELVPGTLLSEDHLLDAGDQLVSPGEAVVGLLLGPGDSPGSVLDRGTPVLVIVRPATTGDEPEQFEGRILDASGEELTSRERPVEVIVPRDAAASVSAAAAEGRVSLVALAE